MAMYAIGTCLYSSRPLRRMRPPARVGLRGHPGPGLDGGAIRAGGRNGCEPRVRIRQQRRQLNFINSSIFSSRAPLPKHQLLPGWAARFDASREPQKRRTACRIGQIIFVQTVRPVCGFEIFSGWQAAWVGNINLQSAR